jgi:hypothetical protein
MAESVKCEIPMSQDLRSGVAVWYATEERVRSLTKLIVLDV